MLCYLMALHDNPMTSNFRIPSFIVAFLRVVRWVVYCAQGRRQLREIGGGGKIKIRRAKLKTSVELDPNFDYS